MDSILSHHVVLPLGDLAQILHDYADSGDGSAEVTSNENFKRMLIEQFNWQTNSHFTYTDQPDPTPYLRMAEQWRTIAKNATSSQKTPTIQTPDDAQSIGRSLTPATSSKIKPQATTALPPPEVHRPSYLIFWLGITVIAAAVAGWLFLRSPKRK